MNKIGCYDTLGFFIWQRESGEAFEPEATKAGEVFFTKSPRQDMSPCQQEIGPEGEWKALDGMAKEGSGNVFLYL